MFYDILRGGCSRNVARTFEHTKATDKSELLEASLFVNLSSGGFFKGLSGLKAAFGKHLETELVCNYCHHACSFMDNNAPSLIYSFHVRSSLCKIRYFADFVEVFSVAGISVVTQTSSSRHS